MSEERGIFINKGTAGVKVRMHHASDSLTARAKLNGQLQCVGTIGSPHSKSTWFAMCPVCHAINPCNNLPSAASGHRFATRSAGKIELTRSFGIRAKPPDSAPLVDNCD